MWINILGIACKLIGLAQWFDDWRKRRYTEKLMQSLADSPITTEELDERLKDHQF